MVSVNRKTHGPKEQMCQDHVHFKVMKGNTIQVITPVIVIIQDN